ncbi:circularly permutated Ras protein 1 [Pelomyxa schiedti]|nr:circularly permutated Ras protein 1 [Pelomyxa schiedti]
MLSFGSKFAYVPRQRQPDQVAVEYSEEALVDNLNDVAPDLDDDLFQAASMPPPPPQQTPLTAPPPPPSTTSPSSTTTSTNSDLDSLLSTLDSMPSPPPVSDLPPPPTSSFAPPPLPPTRMNSAPPRANASSAKPRAFLLQKRLPSQPPQMQQQQMQMQQQQMQMQQQQLQPQMQPQMQQQQQMQQPARKVKHVRAVDTNVFTVKFGFLSQNVELATGDPVFCTACGSCLSSVDKVTTPEGIAQYDIRTAGGAQTWKCTFCGHDNNVHVSPEELPKGDIVDYVLQAPTGTAAASPEATSLVFCVDTSGSMCVSYEMPGKFKLKGDHMTKLSGLNTERADQYLPGQRRETTWVSRLQTLQAAISTQLETLARERPERTVGLVSFNNDVTVFGDGTATPITVAGDKLDNYDELVRQSAELTLTTPIARAKEALSRKLFELEENGQTALGPALVLAAGIAAQKRGSEVVICTDGLANKGIGSMEFIEVPDQREAIERFYENVGLTAKTNGVVVSVLSIKGSEAGVEHLGTVADATGGAVSMIEPTELTKNFSSILANPVIATHVKAKIILHQGMYVRTDDAKNASQSTEEIGNVTAESECTFEYGTKPSEEIPGYDSLEFLPFQVQIEYTKLDGMKCVRIISHKQPITHDLDHAVQDANIEVLGVNAVRQAAKTARSGDYTAARFTNLAHRQLIQKAAKPQQSEQVQAYMAQNCVFEENLLHAQQREVADVGALFDDNDEGAVEAEIAVRKASNMCRRKAARQDSESAAIWSAKNMNAKALYKKS